MITKLKKAWVTLGSKKVFVIWIIALLVAILEFFTAKSIGGIDSSSISDIKVLIIPLLLGIVIGVGRYYISRQQQTLKYTAEQKEQSDILISSLSMSKEEGKTDILNLLNVDSKSASPLFTITLTGIFVGLASFLSATLYAFTISMSLSFWILILCIAGIIIPHFSTKGLSDTQSIQQDYNGKTQRIILQVLNGKVVLNTFHRESYGINLFKSTYDQFAEAQYKTGLKRLRISSIGMGMGFGFDIAILGLEIFFVAMGYISLGQYAAFSLLTPNFTWLFYSLPAIYAELIRNTVSADRVIDFTISQKRDLNYTGATYSDIKNLQLSDLSFSYSKKSPSILQNLSLTVNIDKFEKILITGPSGGGKSTLVKIITGDLTPQKGEIILETATSSIINPAPNYLAYVPQTNEMFEDTIENNLILGRVVDKDRINSILREVELTEFINSLPEGMQTTIGGNLARGLSAGQTQKIGIARALIANRTMLVLDEPFANLDHNSTLEVSRFLSNLENAEIIVSHRLDFPPASLKEVSLDRGKISPGL